MGDVPAQTRLSERRGPALGRLPYGALLGAVALVYFLVAKLGLSFAADNEIFFAVWAPTGLALAAVVVLGYRVWPAIAVGALLANATGDSSLGVAIGIAAGNTLAALAARWLLGRVGFDPALRRLGDAFALALLGAGVGTALGATLGVSSLWAGGVVEAGGLWEAWRVWWLGDLNGVLLIATALLVLAAARPRRPPAARVAEASTLALALVAVTLVALNQGVTMAYPVLPLIALVAIRFRQPGAVLAALVVAALAVAFTAGGEGPFAGGSAGDELLRTQAFVALTAITGLVVAAMRSEWERAKTAAARLADRERALAETQRVAQIGSWEWDIEADRVHWSDELYRIFGAEPGSFEVSYRSYIEFVHPEDRELVAAAVTRAIELADGFEHEHRVVRTDGDIRTLANHGRVVCDAAGTPVRIIGTCRDVTEQRVAQERFHDLLESAPDAMVVADEDGEVVLVNSQTELMFGYEREEVVGQPITMLIPAPATEVHPANQTLFPAPGPGALTGGDRVGLRKDGTEIPIDVNFNPLRTGGRVLTVGSIRDVTAHKITEQQLEHEALHDPLTGLPNRSLFGDRLDHALARSRRPGSNLAVYFCDIDNFKRINDSLGHEAGDELLVALPARLAEALRQADTVARFGGDEFVILCEDLGSEAGALRIAERITEVFRQPFTIEGNEHHVSISVGLVFVEGGMASTSEVLRDADVAMYRAKARGRGKFELFDARMRSRVLKRLEIEADLRRAIREDELRLVYQPVLSLESGGFVSAEALVRWQHPNRGVLGPPDFIDVAEDSGLIMPVGAWVIGEACRHAAAWSEERSDASPLRVSINLSPREVGDWHVAEHLEQALRETGVAPELVELEITETALIEDAEAAMATLTRLKEMGVRLALDDFGTGQSSLSRLKRFPIDALKIDREFIAGIGDDPEDTAIVAAVLSMAWALDVEVVAEGVETYGQLDWLSDHECRYVQGHLLSGPLTAEQVKGLGTWPRGSGGSDRPLPVGGTLEKAAPAPPPRPGDAGGYPAL